MPALLAWWGKDFATILCLGIETSGKRASRTDIFKVDVVEAELLAWCPFAASEYHCLWPLCRSSNVLEVDITELYERCSLDKCMQERVG